MRGQLTSTVTPYEYRLFPKLAAIPEVHNPATAIPTEIKACPSESLLKNRQAGGATCNRAYPPQQFILRGFCRPLPSLLWIGFAALFRFLSAKLLPIHLSFLPSLVPVAH